MIQANSSELPDDLAWQFPLSKPHDHPVFLAITTSQIQLIGAVLPVPHWSIRGQQRKGEQKGQYMPDAADGSQKGALRVSSRLTVSRELLLGQLSSLQTQQPGLCGTGSCCLG